MLILHRRRAEALRIGKDIRIVVLESDGGGTRLGIEAPREIEILREELIEQVQAENLRASRVVLDGRLMPPRVADGAAEPEAMPA
jgi:carbon storage regulator